MQYMRMSPKASAIFYFVFGSLFFYLAILAAETTIWNFKTILFAVFATLDFGLSFRMLKTHLYLKKKNKK